MKTIQEIRNDLKEIRTYYLFKNRIAKGMEMVGDNAVVQLLDKYNTAIRSARANLYTVYICIYVNGLSHEDAACELNYSTQHVERLVKQMLVFFQKAFEGGVRNAG